MSVNSSPETVVIPVDCISVVDRLRGTDMDYVDLIAASMQDNGLIHPLEVMAPDESGQHQLVAGAHRLAAAKLLGWSEVPCIIVEVSGLEARMREIDENLCRRELSPLDRAVFLAERKEIYEEMHPEAKRGGDRRSDEFHQSDSAGILMPGFAEATALKLGIDARSIYRAIARASKIAPDVRALIGGTWIATKGAELDKLAKLEPDQQREVVAKMLNGSEFKSVTAAYEAITGAPLSIENLSTGEFDALVKAWRRAGAKARDGFVNYLNDEGALDELKISEEVDAIFAEAEA